MKHSILLLVFALLYGCCLNVLGGQEVKFEYFNLSTNIIKVTNIVGLPPTATPGVLVPSLAEDELKVAASVFNDSVRIAERIKIVWKENDRSHTLELKRDGLGIPAELKNGKVRFTYLGEEKWRVKLLKNSKS